MPRPQQLLASKLRGYVCRSCMLKLRAPVQNLPQWHSRPASNGGASSYSKPPRSSKGGGPSKSRIRMWEENEGGDREAMDDLNFGEDIPKMPEEFAGEEERFNELLEEKLQQLEEESGVPRDRLIDHFDLEKLYDDCWAEVEEETKNEDPSSQIPDFENESPEAMDPQSQRLRNIMGSLPSIEVLKALPEGARAEARLRVREAVFRHHNLNNFGDTPITSNSPASLLDKEMASSNSSIITSSTIDTTFTSPVEENTHSDLASDSRDQEISLQPLNRNPRVQALHLVIQSTQRSNSRSKRSGGKDSLKPIWKSYLDCRTSIGTLNAIPSLTWTTLWNMFSEKSILSDPTSDPYARLKILGDDMVKVEAPLEPSWGLLYIESLFLKGEKAQAFSMWEMVRPEDGDSKTHFEEYWNLGIRMHCQTHQADQALQAAEVLLMDSRDPLDFRILLPVIQAYTSSKQNLSIEHAWALYIRFRVNMGSRLMMEDYDSVASSLLDANEQDLALSVFTDMMLTGAPTAFQEDSTAHYRAAVASGTDLKSMAITKDELDWGNIPTLAKLPRRFNNKYFFGSWIKKLIGAGELDAANKIFELMQDRQITPDARHMNGLIGAWFREGTERSRAKAEELAWRMIKTRIDFIQSRQSWKTLQSPLRVAGSANLSDVKRVNLIPRATIETFSVLLQQYRQRQKPQPVLDLFDALRKAEILPNTFFMNQLLLTDMRAHKTSWAWETYCNLTKSGKVLPDFETYQILWALMKRSLDPNIRLDPQPQGFTTCRRLFADMIVRSPQLTSTETLPRELYELIILGFSSAQDEVGTAVAMYGLRKHFNIFPSQETARTIIFQLARLGLTLPKAGQNTGLKRRRFQPNRDRGQQRVAAVAEILQKFKNDRAEALLEQGIVYEKLTGDAILEETMTVLSDLLRYVARMRIAREERFNYTAVIASANAAEQMGVPDCAPWEAYSAII